MSVFSLLCLWSLLLVCSVNKLYMELSYTGSLNWSTRAQGMSQFRSLFCNLVL